MSDRRRDRSGPTGLGWSARRDRVRGQSHVVGVALLLGLTVVALAGLTATVGTIVADRTTHADATRVADEFTATLRPVETTGYNRGSVHFSEGSLSVEDRQLRIYNESGRIATVQTDALAFTAGDRRAAFVAGAVVRGDGRNGWLVRDPPVAAGPDVLVVGAPRLNASGADVVGGAGGVTTQLTTNVSHERRSLGRGEFRVAIETTAPTALDAFLTDLDATTSVRDLDGDGVPSLVIDFAGTRRGHLVVHDMRLEVGHG